MIFLTVGTTKYPFSRFFEDIDQVLVDLKSSEQLIAQVGINRHIFKYNNFVVYPEIPFSKMIDYLSKARLVISHAGLGTTMLSLIHSKNKPILVPRIKSFREHIDDHQIFFTQHMEKKDLVKAVYPEGDRTLTLKKFIIKPEKNNYIQNNNRESLINKLDQFTKADY